LSKLIIAYPNASESQLLHYRRDI